MTAASEEVWYILLQGEELGPLSFEEVLDFYYKDVVTSESLLWREGWSGWVPIIQVPEFNELLFQGMIIPNPQPPVVSNDPTAFSGQQQFEHLKNPIVSPELGLITDDQELEDLEELDLSELESDVISSESSHQGPSMVIGHPTHKSKKSKSGGMLLFICFVTILGAAIYAIRPWELINEPIKNTTSTSHAEDHSQSLTLPQSSPTSDIKTKISTLDKSLTKDTGVLSETSLALPTLDPDQDVDIASSEVNSPSNRFEIAPGIEEVELEIKTPIELDLEPSSKPVIKPSKKLKGRKRPSEPRSNTRNKAGSKKEKKAPRDTQSKVLVTLSRGDLMKVLKREKSKFQNCLSKDSNLKGTVNVMVIIQRNGMVTSAKPTSTKLRKSPANQCIIAVTKSLKFPKYTGDLLSIPLPITL